MPQVFFELQMQKHLESRVCACATCTMLLVCKSVAFRFRVIPCAAWTHMNACMHVGLQVFAHAGMQTCRQAGTQ